MAVGEYYSDETLRVSGCLSGRDDLAQVVLFRPNIIAIHSLIEQSQTARPKDYEFAGAHPGMPKNEVWAMTYDSQPIERFVPAIVKDVQKAITKIARA
jgi:hypothetical protein